VSNITILKNGIYRFTEDQYHGDPCPTASLSASLAKVMLNQSPRHAWLAHPKLNPDFETEEKTKFDFGTVAHMLLLGEGREVEVLNFDNFMTKAAKEARDTARAMGKTPILGKDFERAEAMHKAAIAQLAAIDDCHDAFTAGHGQAEATLAWEEFDIDGANPVWCRSKLDWKAEQRPTGHHIIYDYKTSGADVSPQGIARHLFDMQYEIPAAMYERGLEAIHGDAAGKIIMRFVVQETEAPYLLQVAEMDAGGMTIGRKKVSYAIQLWRRCLMENNFPGYPTRIVSAEMPAYLEDKWLRRELSEDDGLNAGDDPFMIASAWIPPTKSKHNPELLASG
jgi:hypothetical protein